MVQRRDHGPLRPRRRGDNWGSHPTTEILQTCLFIEKVLITSFLRNLCCSKYTMLKLLKVNRKC